MKRKVLKITDRVRKAKAAGILFNMPKDEEDRLLKKLKDDLIIDGTGAYTAPMLSFRISNALSVRRLKFNMLPALLEGRMVVLTNTDGIKSSYNRVLEEFHLYKIPILIIMRSGAPMRDFRKLAAYKKVLTIEQDYYNL